MDATPSAVEDTAHTSNPYPSDDVEEKIRLQREALDRCPPNHPDRAKHLNDLSFSFWTRYKNAGVQGDLDTSIHLDTEALALRPAGHPDRDVSLHSLAVSMWTRYNISSARDNLDTSIRLETEALTLRPVGHPERAYSLHSLALDMRTRYKISGARYDLDTSIRLDTEALALRPAGHPDRPYSLRSLSLAVWTRYNIAGARDDLDTSIRLNTEALALRPAGDPDRPYSLFSLARDMWSHYKISGARDELDTSIRLHTEALALRPAGNPVRAHSLHALALVIWTRYNISGVQDDLDTSICLNTEALALRPAGDPDRPYSLFSLARDMWSHYKISGARDELDTSIRLHTEALALRPAGNPVRAHSLHALALVIWTRYNISGVQDDLNTSVLLDTEALDLRPAGNLDRPYSLFALARDMWTRYHISGARDDLDMSIRLHTEALALRPAGNPDRAHSLHALALVIWTRYQILYARIDLDTSIPLDTEALALRPAGHPDRPYSLFSLARDIWSHYKISGARDELDTSIRLHTEALTLRPAGNPDRAHSLHALALVIWTRYNISGVQDDLDTSIRLNTEALGLRPAGHPDRAYSLCSLASDMWYRYQISGVRDDLNTSISLDTEALVLRPIGHPDRANSLQTLAFSLWYTKDLTGRTDEAFRLLKEGCTDIIAPLTESLICMQSWVKWASEIRHNSLTDVYNHVIPFLRRYLTIGPTVTHQFDALKNAADLLLAPMDAAAHAIEDGDVEKAVELLDEGRSLLWSEMRRFREPLLEPSLVGEKLAGEFESTRSELQRLSTIESRHDTVALDGRLKVDAGSRSTASMSYGDLVPQKRKLLEKYEELLERVRQRPGFEDFLRSLPFNKLRDAAKEGPVVIVNCSKLSSHVIIVFASKSPTVIPLEDGFHTEAFDMHRDYRDALQSAGCAKDTSKALQDKLMPLMCRLWDAVVSKVVRELEDSGLPHGSRIWWCPTSVLTALPFHAAGTSEDSVVDAYISSYTPTLKALINARKPTSPSASSPTPSRLHPTFLVVAPPDTTLRFAEKELSVMRELGPVMKSLDSSFATRDSILQHLPSYDWVHFICHGTLSASGDAFDSALILRDGERLALRDIIKADLPDGKFAFLAACHSAEQGRDDSVLRDEILHLSSAMQFTGFRSVIGTLWEMEDKDGPKIAQLFYEKMLEGDDDAGQRHTRAARALWEVTRRMRMSGKVSLDRWANFVHIGA